MSSRTKPGDDPHKRSSSGLRAFLALLSAASCVSAPEDVDPVAVVSPMVVSTQSAPDGTDPALVAFYESVLAQLQEAHRARDFLRMRRLVDTYLIDAAPQWAMPRLQGFRDLSFGLQFERHAAEHAELAQVFAGDEAKPNASGPQPLTPPSDGAAVGSSLVLPGTEAAQVAPAAAKVIDPSATIGAPLDFELRLPTPPDGPWRLGGKDERDPVAFRVTVVIRDRFLDGSMRKVEDAEVVRLEQGVELAVEPLVLPVRFELGSSTCARREIEVFAELLPGYVQAAESRAPVRLTSLAKARVVQWPKGHEAMRAAPLAALQRAMNLGDRDHFLHVRVASEFAAVKDLSATEDLLMGWVRLGTPEQALVAMAALREIDATATAPIGDRDAWLSWWESRR
jgi:hypothetical protein